ncbi:hypothetical protein D3C86_2137340 [compost metagenome]
MRSISYPIAAVATILPSTSTIAVLLGDMVTEHLGLVLTFLFFVMVDPPFYKHFKDKEKSR